MHVRSLNARLTRTTADVEIQSLWARLYTQIPGTLRDPPPHVGRRWPLRTSKSIVSRETSRQIRPSSPLWMGSTPPLAHIRQPNRLRSSVFHVKLPRDSDAAGPCRSCGRRELEAGLVPRGCHGRNAPGTGLDSLNQRAIAMTCDSTAPEVGVSRETLCGSGRVMLSTGATQSEGPVRVPVWERPARAAAGHPVGRRGPQEWSAGAGEGWSVRQD